jgi:hypothetical protein
MFAFIFSIFLYLILLAVLIGSIYWFGKRQPPTHCSIDVESIVKQCPRLDDTDDPEDTNVIDDLEIKLADFNDPSAYPEGIVRYPDVLPIRKDADKRDAFFQAAQYYQKLDEQARHNFIANRYLLTRRLVDIDELDYNENSEWWNTGISQLGEHYE